MSYYYESLMQLVYENICMLHNEGLLRDKDIYIFGLDKSSFGVHSALAKLGYSISGYVEDNTSIVIKTKREISDFAYKFANSYRDFIPILSTEEYIRLDERKILIISQRDSQYIEGILKSNLLEFSKDYFIVLDWNADTSFSKYERDDKRMSLRNIQELQLSMLKVLDDFCRSNKIEYFVFYGTLLGAVRHKGFIPWDDDIDVVMRYNDYVRFHEMFDDERYELEYREKDNCVNYIYPFTKMTDKRTILRERHWPARRVGGVSLDIFPFYNQPDSEFSEYVSYLFESKKQMWQDYYQSMGKIGSWSNTIISQQELLNMYSKKETNLIGNVLSPYGEKDSFDASWFEETVDLDFEDIKVKAPKGYKKCLKTLYGSDWGELPPENERMIPHSYDAYWR